MKIIVDNHMEYSDVPGNYYNLDKFNDDSNYEVLFQGYQIVNNKEQQEKYKNYKKRGYLNLESPCSFLTTKTSIEEHNYFTNVFTICPYSAEWYSKYTKTKFIAIPFPVPFDEIDKFTKEKEVDVMYMGRIMNQDHKEIIRIMNNYNKVFTSPNNYPNPYTPTHLNISTRLKWELLAKSKISICINQAPFIYEQRKDCINSYINIDKHKAFTQKESGVVPQIKSRLTEAMVTKTINLVKRDAWNVVETWFKPNKHFIYWDNYVDLNEKINYISKNFHEFDGIINAAYSEVKKYDINFIYNNIINK